MREESHRQDQERLHILLKAKLRLRKLHLTSKARLKKAARLERSEGRGELAFLRADTYRKLP